MSRASSIALGDIMATKSGSVDPSKFTEEIFDLYSIPAFDRGEPEVVTGSAIGSAKQVVEPGDVLLSKIVPHIRRSWIVGKERGRRIIASGEWIVFRSERANPDYLRQVLVGDPFHTQFMNTVAGVGGSLLRARPAHVAKIAIPLPPLAEQRRIAEVLDRAEALRAKRRAALAQLDSLTQSLFLDLFGDPATGAKKFPTARLGAVTTFIDYRGISPNKQPSGVPLVTARNIKRGWFEAEPQEFIPAEEYVSWMTRGIPRTGDVLFTTEGHTLGSAALLPHFEKAALAQRLIALQPNDQLCSEYLLQIILDRTFQREVYRRATGSAARGISSKQLTEIMVAIPPITLQREFARRVTAVEALKTAQRASLAELDALFATLQHRAFRGEL